MTMTDTAAALRELAKDVREQLGGTTVMFSVHPCGQVSICSLEAENSFAHYEATEAGMVMIHAHPPVNTMPPLDDPCF